MMKRIILLLSLVSLIFISNIEGAVPTRQYANTSGQVIDPDKVTSNEDVIYLYLQAGVEAYKDGSITGDDLISTIAISSSGNMTFSGTTNISGTFQLGGTTITATATNINNIAGLTASASELNILDNATLSTTELNYVDGVTSAIQTQLDGKSATTGNASIVTVGTITTGGWAATAVPVAYGGTGATSAGDARTNLGLGSIATQASNSVTITGGSITGITDLAIADGGTGSSSTTYCNLASNVTGTLPVANGGTGVTSGTFTRIYSSSYAGDNGATKAITGVGFQPKAVYIFSDSAFVVKVESMGTLAFGGNANQFQLLADGIISMDGDGFTVGDGTGWAANFFNVSGTTYYFICLG